MKKEFSYLFLLAYR